MSECLRCDCIRVLVEYLIDPGYQDSQPSHEEAFEKLLGRIHPGAIVLLHSTSSTNAEILDELLTKWEEMGYHFASLDDLIKATAS